MPLLGQALQPGYYWSGTKVCAGPGAARYQGAVACWEYYRAPLDVFATEAYRPPEPIVSPYTPPPPPPGPALPPGPMILPPAETTGGVGSPPASVDVGCGCHKDAGTVTQPTPSGPTPSAPPAPIPSTTEPTARMVLERLQGLPWWVYALGVLVLSQLLNRDGARAR